MHEFQKRYLAKRFPTIKCSKTLPSLAEDPIAYEPCPYYSTDIKDAWNVVEKLLKMLPNKDFHIEHWADESFNGWQVSSFFGLGK